MAVFLQILGGITLALIVALVVGVLLVRYKLRRLMREIREIGESTTVGAPARVRLRALAAPSWGDENEVTAVAERLPSLGFRPVGLYQVAGVDNLGLAAFVNEADRAYAVVYEYAYAGVWVDFVTRYPDGGGYTCTNSVDVPNERHRPGVTVARFPGLDVDELYRRFLAGRPPGPMSTPTAEAFADEFERAYADDMDWRASQEGRPFTTFEALGAPARDDEDDEDDEDEDEEIEALERAIRAEFLRTATISAARWEALRDRLLIVHDEMDPDDLEYLISIYLDETDWTPSPPLRDAFAAFNDGLPPAHRFEKLGAVGTPVAADLYAAPEA